MKKTLERLRQLKSKAVERMEALNALAKKDARELNETEKQEFAGKEAEVAELAASITELEQQEPVLGISAAPSITGTEAVRMERERVADIDTAAATFLRRGEIDAVFVESFKRGGKTVQEFKTAIAEKLAQRSDENPISGAQPTGAVAVDARDKMREGMGAALHYRANASDSKLRDAGREYAGLTLVDMARECLEAAGVKTRGMSRDDIARVALQGRFGAAEYFAGSITTSDLPSILANVANKTLRAAYEAAPRTFTMFCRQVSATDFKPINRVQLSDVATLPKINEKGEFHRTALSDSKETYSLATFGEIVAITRKTIVNDDLQALTRVPAGLGQAAANLESDTVWTVMTANAAMSDAVVLFHATHKNLNTTNPLTNATNATDNIGKGRAAMRKQVGPKGTKLNLNPRYLIASVTQETEALRLLYPVQLAAGVVGATVPDYVRNLTLITEPRLDDAANGTTTWYLAADPAQIDTIEFCYLEGQQGVYIETRQGFDVDGMEIKARLDFAAGAIDFRGLQKNTA